MQSTLELLALLFLYCWHQQISWSLLSFILVFRSLLNIFCSQVLLSSSVTSASMWKDHQNFLFSLFLDILIATDFFVFWFSHSFNSQIGDIFYTSKCITKTLMTNIPPSELQSSPSSFVQVSSLVQFSSSLALTLGHSYCSSLTIHKYTLSCLQIPHFRFQIPCLSLTII